MRNNDGFKTSKYSYRSLNLKMCKIPNGICVINISYMVFESIVMDEVYW